MMNKPSTCRGTGHKAHGISFARFLRSLQQNPALMAQGRSCTTVSCTPKHFQPLTQTIRTPSTPWVKRVSLQGFLHHWKKLRPLLLQMTCLECRIQRERPHSKSDSNWSESSCWQIFQQMNSASHDSPCFLDKELFGFITQRTQGGEVQVPAPFLHT